jgi:hypothetical protein
LSACLVSGSLSIYLYIYIYIAWSAGLVWSGNL